MRVSARQLTPPLRGGRVASKPHEGENCSFGSQKGRERERERERKMEFHRCSLCLSHLFSLFFWFVSVVSGWIASGNEITHFVLSANSHERAAGINALIVARISLRTSLFELITVLKCYKYLTPCRRGDNVDFTLLKLGRKYTC